MIRSLALSLAALSALALGAWAYRENYATRAALARAGALQQEIAALRGDLVMLRAEWAYLNRPERLRRLAAMHFDRLGLMPLAPEQFARPAQIDFPPAPLPRLARTVPLIGRQPAAAEAAR